MQEAYVRGTLPISIHALRKESDWDISVFNHPARNFNPRSP